MIRLFRQGQEVCLAQAFVFFRLIFIDFAMILLHVLTINYKTNKIG